MPMLEELPAASSCCHQRSMEFSEPARAPGLLAYRADSRAQNPYRWHAAADQMSEWRSACVIVPYRRTLAEHAPAPRATISEALFNRRRHLIQEEVLPRTHRF